MENRKIIIEVIKESNSIPKAWEVIKVKLTKLRELIKFNTFKVYVKTINAIDKIMENNENINKEKENIRKKLEKIRQEKNSIKKELGKVRQELKVVNLGFADWTQIFEEATLTTVLLDRLTGACWISYTKKTIIFYNMLIYK